MAGKSAILTVKILTDASKAAQGMDTTTSKMGKFQSGLSKGAKIGGAALVGLAAGAAKATLAAEEVASANSRVGQTLENAGMGKATDRVLAYAESLESSLGIDEKVIKNTQAKLATFHNLSGSADEAGGAFDRATVAAQDMAAAGFGDAESNAVQLGKALNDPVKGITALNRSGVTFSDEQKKMIKSMQETGDMAGAQDVILDELEKQVGGTAAATADSSAKMSLAFADVGETIGSALLPVMDQLAPVIEDIAGWMKDNSDKALLLGGIIAGLAAAVIAANAALKIYQATQVAWNAITKVATAVQKGLNAVMRANPVGIVITAIMLLIGVIVLLWNKNAAFRDFVKGVWKAIATAAKAAWNGIKAVVSTVVTWIATRIKAVSVVIKAIWKAIRTVAAGAWNGIKAVVAGVAGKIKGFMRGVKTVVTAIWKAIKTAATTAWSGIKSSVKAVTDWIKTAIRVVKTVVTAVWKTIKSAASTAWSGVKSSVKNVMDWIKSAIRVVKTVVNGVWTAIKSAASTAWSGVKTTISTVTGWIKTTINTVKTVVNGVWTSIKSAAQTAFTPIKTAVNGIKTAFDSVKSAVQSVVDWFGRIKVPHISWPKPPAWVDKLFAVPPEPAAPTAYRVGTRPGPGLLGAPARPGVSVDGSGGNIVININGGLSSASDIARQVRRSLRNDSRRRGGVILSRQRREVMS